MEENLDNSHSFILNIVFKDGDGDENRKAFIRWMKDNVGVRGADWSIDKPRGSRNVNRVRIADKAKASLVKMMYIELIVPDDRLHKSYIR